MKSRPRVLHTPLSLSPSCAAKETPAPRLRAGISDRSPLRQLDHAGDVALVVSCLPQDTCPADSDIWADSVTSGRRKGCVVMASFSLDIRGNSWMSPRFLQLPVDHLSLHAVAAFGRSCVCLGESVGMLADDVRVLAITGQVCPLVRIVLVVVEFLSRSSSR